MDGVVDPLIADLRRCGERLRAREAADPGSVRTYRAEELAYVDAPADRYVADARYLTKRPVPAAPARCGARARSSRATRRAARRRATVSRDDGGSDEGEPGLARPDLGAGVVA